MSPEGWKSIETNKSLAISWESNDWDLYGEFVRWFTGIEGLTCFDNLILRLRHAVMGKCIVEVSLIDLELRRDLLKASNRAAVAKILSRAAAKVFELKFHLLRLKSNKTFIVQTSSLSHILLCQSNAL